MGRCVDGCRDDDAEPNDSLEAAVALTFEDEFDSGEQGPFKACDGSLGGNVDYFSFVVPEEGMTIKVSASFTHADGDVDIVLYRPDGSRVEAPLIDGLAFDPSYPKCDKQGTSCTDNELVIYPSTGSRTNPSGVWSVKARAIGIDSNSYGLRVELATGAGQTMRRSTIYLLSRLYWTCLGWRIRPWLTFEPFTPTMKIGLRFS